MERGRCCCPVSRLPRTLRAGSTGTFRWTRLSCGPTSTPPVRGRRRRPPILKRGTRGGRIGSIRCCGNWWSGSRKWSDPRVPGTLPRRIHHQNPPRRRRAMQASRARPDTGTLRRRPPVRACPGAGRRTPYRSRKAPHPARPCPGRQGLHIPEQPPLPATTRNPPHHPRTPRPAKTPQEPRLPRWSAHRLRQRAIQETQHRRTNHQPPQGLPRRRHPLRETRPHLPRHRHPRSPHHLAAHMIRETAPRRVPAHTPLRTAAGGRRHGEGPAESPDCAARRSPSWPV